ncbi:MAG: hypothetical protein ACRDNO_06210 [Trebonia sp.]
MTDPALDFWLRHVAADGGLHEPSGDATYVVLPTALSERYRLPEELRVTADPDIARDDGITLLTLGHPVLANAAEQVLAAGDAGVVRLRPPASVPPSPEVLLKALREAVPVDHGKIDVADPPASVRHPVLRVGALVTFELSAEDQFQEQAERWVDVPSRRLLPTAITGRLALAEPDEALAPDLAGPGDVWGAAAEAHRLIDAAALARRAELAVGVRDVYQAERDRAVSYYADAVAGIEKRLAAAAADRKAVLEERLRATREEEARRLAEIAEKYAASHAIRPYRLHVLEVPALRLSAEVLRGSRRYPMTFDWLLSAGAFAPVRCPSCGSEAPLVAGKQSLGCESCLTARVQPDAPSVSVITSTPTTGPGLGPVPKTETKTQPASAAKPVPAKAKQMRKPPALPPDELAERLWTQVAKGMAGNASPVLAPGSPAEVLYEVLGPSGLTQVVGFPPDVPPSGYSVGGYRLPAGQGVLAAGTLYGSDDDDRAYFLSGQEGLVAEVLPSHVLQDGRLSPGYWWHDPGDPHWHPSRVPADADIDVVGRILLGTGPSWNGLCVAARSVAAWERIGDSHERILDGRAPRVVAAAADRLVAYRAGGRGTFADAAAVYRVDEAAVRSADRAIRPVLALATGRPW